MFKPSFIINLNRLDNHWELIVNLIILYNEGTNYFTLAPTIARLEENTTCAAEETLLEEGTPSGVAKEAEEVELFVEHYRK